MTPYRLAPPGGASRAQLQIVPAHGATRKLPSAFRRRRISWLRPTAIPSVWRPTARRVKPWRTDRNLRQIALWRRGPGSSSWGGHAIGRAIMQLVETGRWPYLEQLRGSADPVRLFQMIPGIGPELAQRIHDTRMSRHRATGRRRLTEGAWIKCPVLGHAGRRCCEPHWRGCSRGRSARCSAGALWPSVDRLLDIDREYRNGLTIFGDGAAASTPLARRGFPSCTPSGANGPSQPFILIRQEPMNSGKRRNGW